MRRRVIAAVTSLSFILLSLGGPVFAAQMQQPGGAQQPPPPYRLRPGDVITVTVTPQGGVYNRQVKILPDGRIYYPVVGEVVAAGKTVTEVRDILDRGLAAELRGHRVSVDVTPGPDPVPGAPGGRAIDDQGRGRVTVMGAVRQPQVLGLLENMRLPEAIVQAGGPAPDADLSRVTITRDDLTVATVDFYSEAGRLFRLRAGDIVVVPGSQGSALSAAALGEVVRPGPADNLRPGATLLDLMKAAGGPTPNADLKNATLHRVGTEGPIPIDLEALWVRGDVSLNQRLVSGDALAIPRNKANYIYVLGGVSKPGAYPVRGGETFADILAQGGTPTESADLSKVTLSRLSSPGGTRAVKKIDLAKMNQGDTSVLGLEVQAGDIIVVPTRKNRLGQQNRSLNNFAMVTSLLGLVTALGNNNNNNRNNRNTGTGGGLGGGSFRP